MKTPSKISIFEEDFQRGDHRVTYGINQDGCVKGLVHYVRKDILLEWAKEQKAKVLSGELTDVSAGLNGVYDQFIAKLNSL